MSGSPAHRLERIDSSALCTKLAQVDGAEQLHEFLQEQARFTGAIAGAIIELKPDGSAGVISYWPKPPEAQPQWLTTALEHAPSAAGETMAVRLGEAGPYYASRESEYVLVHPLTPPLPAGVFSILHLAGQDTEALAEVSARLSLSTLALVAAKEHQLAQTERASREQLTRAFDVLVAAHEHEHFDAIVVAFCNQLASALRAQRVAVGMVQGGAVRLRGLSHSDETPRTTALAQAIERVMEEVLDQQTLLNYPPDKQSMVICRAADELVAEHGPRAMCVLPAQHHQQQAMVVLVEREAGRHFDEADEDLIRLTSELCVPRLVEGARRSRWLGVRAALAVQDWGRWLVGPQHTWAKLGTLVAIAFLAFAFFARGADQVEAPFVIQPTRQSVVAAPFDAVIAASEIRPGDSVHAQKSVLVQLDDTELQLQRVAAMAERAALLQEAEQQRAQQRPAEARLAALKAESLKHQLTLLDLQIERARVEAPIDGTVLSGDLTHRIGAPVKQGEALFEIAPQHLVRGELRVGDDDIWRLAVGQGGELASVSHPGERVAFEIDRIFPVAEVVSRRNVFPVEVRLLEDQNNAAASWLRPGVEGQARVQIGRERYIVLWTRDVANWLRMKLWW